MPVHRRYPRRIHAWLLVACLATAAMGCKSETPESFNRFATAEKIIEEEPITRASFTEVTAEAGIDFVPRNGEEQKVFSILETLGVGVAWIDYDLDGQLDLFFPGGGTFAGREVVGRAGQLLRGTGRRFGDVTAAAHVDDASLYTHGAIVGDYDNDGFRDLLVTGYGDLRLFRNCGDGTFLELADAAGLTLASWSTGAAWGDYNADGVLDLYVVNYLDWSFENHPSCQRSGQRSVCSPIEFSGRPDALYLADGEGGFRRAPLPTSSDGKGLAVVSADLDLDGNLDLYVANDTTPNFLFLGLGNGNFEEIGIESGTALSNTASADGSMGVDVGDFNQDGLPDLWVANFEGQSFALYENLGGTFFNHVSDAAGISAVGGSYVGFGTMFFDFDCDGDEDLFSGNGHVTPVSANSPFRQLPLLFENQGGERFVNVASRAGTYMSQPHMARGAATADWDGDGDPDLAIAHTNEPVTLLENSTTAGANFISIALIGRASPRQPFGARVTVKTEHGRQHADLASGASYLSSSDTSLLFGLAAYQGPVDVSIHWPSGRQQSLRLDSNQHHTLVEPRGRR